MDRNSLLPLEVHRVHLRAHSIPATDLMDLVNSPRVEEHPLREGGFSGVDVGRDSDVAHAVHRLPPTGILFLLGTRRGRHRPPLDAIRQALEDEDGQRAEPVALRAAEGREEAGGAWSRHGKRRRSGVGSAKP